MPHQRNDSQFNQNNNLNQVAPNNQMENHNEGRKGVPHPQNRRLMETSNMFSVYRNSLKTGYGGANPGGSLMVNQ